MSRDRSGNGSTGGGFGGRARRRGGRLSLAAALLGAAITVLSALAAEIDNADGVSLDDLVFDVYQRWRPRDYDPDLPVRVVDIDRASIQRFGQWPWPRTYLAELAERLHAAGAAVIAFDMLFSEPDRTSPEVLRADFSAFAQQPSTPRIGRETMTEHDILFGRALAGKNAVLGAMMTDGAGASAFEGGGSISRLGGDVSARLFGVPGVEPPLGALMPGAAGVGVIGLVERGASVLRALPMVVRVGDGMAPALALEALRLAVSARGHLLKAEGDPPAPVSVRTGPFEIPLTARGALRIRFAGSRPERFVSAREILEDASPTAPWRAQVNGRIVLVGSSAPGVAYAVDTPLAQGRLGVEVQAEAIEHVLSGERLLRPDWTTGLERTAILVFGALGTLIMALRRPALGALFFVAAVGASFGLSAYLFADGGLLAGPVYPALAAAQTVIGLGAFNYARADAERRAIRNQFEHFLAPDVIEQISSDPERFLTPGGEARELSIMFCDVRGFSSATERMSPAEVIAFVNDILTPISECILDHGGTIDKYMGDAVMAFWNAPRPSPDYRARAVECAYAVREAIVALNARRAAEGATPIGIGIGLNNGDCSVGSMGSQRRLEYSCIGDPVNLASRLEGLTKAYGAWICAGPEALDEAARRWAVELDLVAVKGRSRPVRVHTLLDRSDASGPGAQALRARLERLHAAYRAGDWDGAEAALPDLLTGPVAGYDPAPLVAFYQERIALHRAAPPGPDWDGAYAVPFK